MPNRKVTGDDRCQNCGKLRKDHWLTSWTNGIITTGDVPVCPTSVFKAAEWTGYCGDCGHHVDQHPAAGIACMGAERKFDCDCGGYKAVKVTP